MVTLGFFPNTTITEIQMRLGPIRRDMEASIPGAKVTIVSEAMGSRASCFAPGMS